MTAQMTIRSLVLIVAGLFLGASLSNAFVSSPRLEAGLGDDLRGVLSDDVATRGATLSAWRDNRGKSLRALIEIVDTPKPQYTTFDSRQLAALVLGDMRAPEAVRALVNNISWKYEFGIADSESPWLIEGYPCAEALSQMGISCIPALLEHLSRNRATDEEYQVAARLLAQIYGLNEANGAGGRTEALGAVERYAARTTETRAANLQHLYSRLKQIYSQRARRGAE